MAIEKWRPYLQRQEFIICTDHKSLSYLTEQNLQSELQRKAMTRLMGLQFRVVYRKGKDNVAADALSRVGHLMAIQAVSTATPKWIQEVLNSYHTDPVAQKLLQSLTVHSPDEQGFYLENGLIKLKQHIWVGQNSALRTKIIAALHASPIGGHSGIQPTYYKVKNYFHWKGLKQDVEDFVKQCVVCQQAKHEHTHPAGLLQPLPIPEGAWQDISLDFIEGLPMSGNCNVILVIVDRFTKYAHFLPLKHPFTAGQVANLLLDSVIKLHGVPKTMVSDRDRVFLSAVWQGLFSQLGTKLLYSTAYHPQTDGQTERVNQCLEMYLRCSVHHSPKTWKAWLPVAELWYNSSFHSSLGCSPFKALYGYELNLGINTISGDPASLETTVSEIIQEREAHVAMLKQQLAVAQNRMKIQADKNRVDRTFLVGEQVLLKLQPYAQSSVANRPYPKLAYKFFGPFEILEKVGCAAYKLALPSDSQIHNVFHVSQLKPFIPNHSPVYSDIGTLTDLSTHDTEPEFVLDRRLVKKGNSAVPQVLVKWSKLPATSSTWEDFYVVKKAFPAATAWGQAAAQGGGDVIAQDAPST